MTSEHMFATSQGHIAMPRLQVDWSTRSLSDTKRGYLQLWHWEDLCGWSALQSELPHLYYAAACLVHTRSSLIICGSLAQYTEAWKEFCPNLSCTNYSIDCTYTSSQEYTLNPFPCAHCATVCIISQHVHYTQYAYFTTEYSIKWTVCTLYYACTVCMYVYTYSRILNHCMYTEPLYLCTL